MRDYRYCWGKRAGRNGRCGILFPSSGIRTWSIFPHQMMADGVGCLILAIVLVFRTLIHVYSGSKLTNQCWGHMFSLGSWNEMIIKVIPPQTILWFQEPSLKPAVNLDFWTAEKSALFQDLLFPTTFERRSLAWAGLKNQQLAQKSKFRPGYSMSLPTGTDTKGKITTSRGHFFQFNISLHSS